jgi:hypothetical protein
MRVADCALRQVFAESGVPRFDINGPQFLQLLLPEVRRDLIGQKFTISRGRPGGDVALAFPLIDALFDKFADGLSVGSVENLDQGPQSGVARSNARSGGRILIFLKTVAAPLPPGRGL